MTSVAVVRRNDLHDSRSNRRPTFVTLIGAAAAAAAVVGIAIVVTTNDGPSAIVTQVDQSTTVPEVDRLIRRRFLCQP